MELVIDGVSEVAVLGDSDRLAQVLDNLLSNACKFSPPGGKVRVRAIASADRVRILVQDHGPGIPAEYKPRIFERFSQADSASTRQHSGSGLSLAIAKSIVELHGGTIGFVSEADRGTTFWFELAREETPAADLARTMPPAPPTAAHVLVVEDDADVGLVIGLMLRARGFRATAVGSAKEAREVLDSQRVDAMTLDVHLPGENGLSFLQSIRTDPRHANLPVVVVSGSRGEPVENLKPGALGLLDWIAKPVSEDRLYRALQGVRERDSQPPRVLHVDDDPVTRRMLGSLIGSAMELGQARSLAEARAVLGSSRWDLVVLDLGLPDGDGLDLLPVITALVPPPKVVIFSGREVQANDLDGVAAALLKLRSGEDDVATVIRSLIR